MLFSSFRATRKTTAAAITASLILQGCATHPDDISASYVSPMRYNSYSCDQIAAEVERVSRNVSQLTGQQRQQATKDAWALGVGMVLLFWPALFFMVGEDRKEELAALKGEYEALEQDAIQKDCKIQLPKPETVTAKAAEPVAVQASVPGRRAKPGTAAYPE